MTAANRFDKLAQSAGVDMTKAQEGGAKREAPAKGPTGVRFVAYIEVGKQVRKIKGETKIEDQVLYVFELIGKKHPPYQTDDGPMPVRMTITLNNSRDARSGNFQLFQRMNYEGKATHPVQLLGKAYKGNVTHREGDKVTFADLDHKSITSPTYEVISAEGEATGEFKTLTVGPALTPLKAFVWAVSDLEDWDALFIPGEFPSRQREDGTTIPAKSKNVLQDKIRSATNFEGSNIATLLAARSAGVKEADLPSAEDVDTSEGSADAGWDDASDDIPF